MRFPLDRRVCRTVFSVFEAGAGKHAYADVLLAAGDNGIGRRADRRRYKQTYRPAPEALNKDTSVLSQSGDRGGCFFSRLGSLFLAVVLLPQTRRKRQRYIKYNNTGLAFWRFISCELDTRRFPFAGCNEYCTYSAAYKRRNTVCDCYPVKHQCSAAAEYPC